MSILLQEITQHLNPNRKYPLIHTLGVFETVEDAHQAAINRCHEYVRDNQMEWSAPQYDGSWQAGETLTGEYEGDYWRQIAPMGYEYQHNNRLAWLRLEYLR